MHFVRQTLLGLITVAVGQFPALAGDYTVYFCNPQKTPSSVQAYVWQDAQTTLTSWDGKEYMKRTRYYVERPAGKAQVFSYSFSWDNTPNNLLFFQELVNNKQERLQSEDYTFTDGALYDMSGAKYDPGTLYYDLKELEPQTVYFADKGGWGASSTLVHAWNPQTDYTLWAQNESMEDTGKFVYIDGVYYPLYKYEMYMPEGLTSCLFHRANSSMQTPDCELVKNGVYYYDGNSSEVVPVTNPDIVDRIPEVTVYFADTGRWGAEATKVHVWGSAGELTPWASNDPMTDTGKYARVGDVWAKVYSYTYVYPGKVDGIVFHKDAVVTPDCKAIPGALYYFKGTKVPVEPVEFPEFADEIPQEDKRPATFYVNLGANQMMTGLWKEPCAHVWSYDPDRTYESDIPAYGSEAYQAEKMEKVRDGMYKITVDDISGCSDIIFYYYSPVYYEGEITYSVNVFPASRSRYFNPTSWATFMYDIGIDCVHQSYLTPEAYNRQWTSLPEALYVTGNKTVTGHDVDDPRYCIEINADEGVYINKFTLAEGDAAVFKLSCIDVMGSFADLGLPESAYESQRGWATFNMGIIGCQRPDNDSNWDQKFIYAPGNGQSRQVKLPLNYSMTYNNYTQYPWRIAAGNDGIEKGGDYWLVVDLHDADHSLTLLTFDPNPAIEVSPGEIRSATIGAETASKLHDQSVMSGNGTNGPVYFNKVNVVSGKATISQAPGNNLLSDNLYTVVYTVYLENIPVARYDYVPNEVEIPYMTAGRDAKVAVRARYTHQTTDVSFCSRMAIGTISPEAPLLPEPVSNDVNGTLIAYYDGPREDLTCPVGGGATFQYQLANAEHLAYFPDYEVLSVETSDGEADPANVLVHSGHEVIRARLFGTYLGAMSPSPWLPASGDISPSDWSDANNWPAYIAAEKQLPLLIKELSRTDRVPADFNATAKVRIDAIYPFLVQDLDATAVRLPEIRRNPSMRVADNTVISSDDILLPEKLEGFTIIPMTKSTTATVTFADRVISGIETVASSTDESEALYYTVDGKPLPSRPTAPGIYLKKTGPNTSKIIVR